MTKKNQPKQYPHLLHDGERFRAVVRHPVRQDGCQLVYVERLERDLLGRRSWRQHAILLLDAAGLATLASLAAARML